jgi:glycosyltransferase involved in cell wall biosynthesis
MISIITCSVSVNQLNQLSASLERTVNVPYELIAFDNSKVNYPITKAYNIAASSAKNDLIIFIHEDIEFLEIGWAKRLLTILNNHNYGIVGVAGSTYLPSVPSGWYLLDEKYNLVYVHQGFKYKEAPVRFDNQGIDLTPVFLLDGVFLAMRKEVWQQFQFNENLKGFHAYDVDICQRVSSKYQNVFTNQIEIIHHSEGKVDKNYFDTILNYKLRYLNFVYPKRDYKLEYQLLNQFYSHLRCFYDKKDCIEKISPFIKLNYLGWKGYFSFKKMLRHAK